MVRLYYKELVDDAFYWLPVSTSTGATILFQDVHFAVEAAMDIKADEFEIRTSAHERSLKGLRFGKEILWRLNGKHRSIQYRGTTNRFV